jgi:hypothetical protein
VSESPRTPECVPPPQLEGALTDENFAYVRAVPGPHDRSLAIWLESWRTQLERFWQQMDVPGEQWNDQTWHRNDWVGALHARALIAQILQSADAPPECLRWLDQADAFMRCFTVEPPKPWNAEPQPTGAWWWQRLPIRGPVTSGWWADR